MVTTYQIFAVKQLEPSSCLGMNQGWQRAALILLPGIISQSQAIVTALCERIFYYSFGILLLWWWKKPYLKTPTSVWGRLFSSKVWLIYFFFPPLVDFTSYPTPSPLMATLSAAWRTALPSTAFRREEKAASVCLWKGRTLRRDRGGRARCSTLTTSCLRSLPWFLAPFFKAVL